MALGTPLTEKLLLLKIFMGWHGLRYWFGLP
jgi:hypothetical protein